MKQKAIKTCRISSYTNSSLQIGILYQLSDPHQKTMNMFKDYLDEHWKNEKLRITDLKQENKEESVI